MDVAVDSEGSIVFTGYTGGALGEGNATSWDLYVGKLNSSGSLQWLTQLGDSTAPVGGDTSGNDYSRWVAVDSNNNIYCSGETSGSLGETNGAGDDAFILKLNSSGSIQWLTQLGDSMIPDGQSSSGEIEVPADLWDSPP